MSLHDILGAALREHQNGRLAEAEQGYRQVLALAPKQPDALHLLGVIALQVGRPEQAVELIQAAITHHDGNAEFHNNLGQALDGLGRWQQAVDCYRRALELAPEFAVAFNNLGNALHRLKDFAAAENAYRAALRHAPGYGQGHYNLGNLLQDAGRTAEAVDAFRQALTHQPGLVDAAKNLANAPLSSGEVDPAATVLEQALRQAPTDAGAWCNYGNVLKQQGRMVDAVAAYRRAVELDPRQPVAWSNLLYSLHFHPAYSNGHIAAEHRVWLQTVHPRPVAGATHRTPAPARRRLRIGYVSPDFFHQAESFFVLPLLLAHDRTQFEVHAFSSVAKPDALTERFRRAVEHWHDVAALSDAELTAKIAAEEIDILVDLTMHMANNRLAVFAQKPSPVQVTWLAYPGSTGLPTIDYRLTDEFMEPTPEATEYSAETPVRLPDSWCCYDPLFPTPECSPLPALSSDHVTFGSLNHPGKHNEEVIRLWAELLRAKDDARLLLLCAGRSASTRLQEAFARHGVATGRVELVEPASRSRYLEYYARIDVALDPFPYNGITTTCDALWMGVPVLTLPGSTPASRAGRSLLSTVGLPDWIGSSPEDFIQRALRLSADRPQLARLRAGLRQQMQESPLADAPRFARAVEAAFLKMWRHGRSRHHKPAAAATRTVPDSPEAKTPVPNSFSVRLANAVSIHRAGNPAAALAAYNQLLAENPLSAELLYLSAIASAELSQFETALTQVTAALAVDDRRVEAHLLQGGLRKKMAQPEGALASYDRAATLQPDNPEIYYLRGNVRLETNAAAAALADFEQALRLRPNYPDVLNHRGLALQLLGRSEEAKRAVEDALKLAPGNPSYHTSLGQVLDQLGATAQARAAFEAAVKLAPGHVAALNNLGNHLVCAGELPAAVACYEAAVANAPTLQETHSNLGLALKEAGQIPRAVACFRRAMELQPSNPLPHSNLLLTLHYDAICGPGELLAEHRRWNERHASRFKLRPRQVSKDPHRRLRVGYVSPDFRNHPVARFIAPILEHHARNQFEVFAYADVLRPDPATIGLQRCTEHWRDISSRSDEDVVRQIHADQIDILVDLAGHTARNRLLVFARKPAPVQVSYLGYPDTTGLSAMDYRIVDGYSDPAGLTDPFATEELCRLPETAWCFRPPPGSPDPALAGIRAADEFWFGSFNNLAKLSDAAVALWSRVLQAAPAAKLLVKAQGLADPRMQEQVRGRFARAGAAPQRVHLSGWTESPAEHLEWYRKVDVALDSLPYHGTTTTCEALWMGVPVITLAGQMHHSRVGVSLLTNAGHPEWIAHTEADYIRIAADLAASPARLAELKSGLRSEIDASPLRNERRFVPNLEALYHKIWQRWCENPGSAATVAPDPK